jgi:hypothetical protein
MVGKNTMLMLYNLVILPQCILFFDSTIEVVFST